jgi:hypothetical protein
MNASPAAIFEASWGLLVTGRSPTVARYGLEPWKQSMRADPKALLPSCVCLLTFGLVSFRSRSEDGRAEALHSGEHDTGDSSNRPSRCALLSVLCALLMLTSESHIVSVAVTFVAGSLARVEQRRLVLPAVSVSHCGAERALSGQDAVWTWCRGRGSGRALRAHLEPSTMIKRHDTLRPNEDGALASLLLPLATSRRARCLDSTAPTTVSGEVGQCSIR